MSTSLPSSARDRADRRPPTALTIAGSDSGGGAGIQADLKTFTALGVYGTSAITALTAQNTQGVQGVIPIDPDGVAQQITSVLDDIPLEATKLGMLTSAGTIAAVAELIAERGAQFGRLVLDPVMVATSGDVLLPDEAAQVLRRRLLPQVHVITPNLPEAARLLEEDVAGDVETMGEQAMRLRRLGPDVVVVKGGHHDGEEVTDVIAHPGGRDLLRARRVPTRNTHGTGCTLSSAIAAQYARLDRTREGATAPALPTAITDAATTAGGAPAGGSDLVAVTAGRDFLQRALLSGAGFDLSPRPPHGHGPVDHLITLTEITPS